MNKIVTILVLSIISLNAISKEINYRSKMLNKELAKTWEITPNDLIEVSDFQEEYMGNGKFYRAEKQGQFLGYVFIGRVTSCRAGGCTAEPIMATSENSEYFDVFMLISANNQVDCVRVFNYQATHGQEICSKGWLKQFIKSPSDNNYSVGKDIDSISGATISVYAVTNEVNKVIAVLN